MVWKSWGAAPLPLQRIALLLLAAALPLCSGAGDVTLSFTMDARSFLAWNCWGSGGSLRSSKMTHLVRLLTSTKCQQQASAPIKDPTPAVPQANVVDGKQDAQIAHQARTPASRASGAR